LLDARTGGYGQREGQNKSAGGKENWQQRGDGHDKRKGPYRKQTGHNRYDNQRSGDRRGGDHQQDHQKRGEYQRNQRGRPNTNFRNF